MGWGGVRGNGMGWTRPEQSVIGPETNRGVHALVRKICIAGTKPFRCCVFDSCSVSGTLLYVLVSVQTFCLRVHLCWREIVCEAAALCTDACS